MPSQNISSDVHMPFFFQTENQVGEKLCEPKMAQGRASEGGKVEKSAGNAEPEKG